VPSNAMWEAKQWHHLHLSRENIQKCNRWRIYVHVFLIPCINAYLVRYTI